MERIQNTIRNRNGFLIVEALVAIGIMGIVLFGIISMMEMVNFNGGRISLTLARNELLNRIRMNATRVETIEASARMTEALGVNGLTPNVGTANNLVNYQNLSRCLPNIETVSGCSKADMDDPTKGNRFYLSDGRSEDPTKAIAGQDVYYTIRGVRCSQIDAEANPNMCPMMAMAWAEPFCLDFSTNCNKAMSLTIRYSVSFRPEYTGKIVVPPVESEVYVPLAKGIQMTGVTDQNGIPISINDSGIYSVQKYFGLTDQAGLPTGIRFLVTLGNPTGLTSMRLQYRSIVGSAANGLFDDAIPGSLLSASWVDLPDPTDNSVPWQVSLNLAKPNQVIDFGRQTAATNYGTVNKSFAIGATASDPITTVQKYFWTFDTATNSLVPPTFKSGFYQFRVVATDILSGSVESTNNITLRIVPRTQLIPAPSQPASSQFRNCTSNNYADYRYYVVDDEILGTQNVTLDGVAQTITQVTGASGILTYRLNLSQDIGNVSDKLMTLSITVANAFTGRQIQGHTLSATNENYQITLRQQDPVVQNFTIANNPIRMGATTALTATQTTGSCCTENPNVTFEYQTVPEVPAGSMLSGPGSNSVSCTLDDAANTRVCTSTVNIRGELEGPPTASGSNIKATFSYATNSYACNRNSPTSQVKSDYYQVINLPGIQFYLPESLWLTMIPGAAGSIKAIQPKLRIRIDFAPSEDVSVRAVTTTGVEICTVTFTGSPTPGNPIDRECNISPSTFNGKINLERVSSNIMRPSDGANPNFVAKLTPNKLVHTVCQKNLTDELSGRFQPYTPASTIELRQTPWGLTSTGAEWPGNEIQWTSADTKIFKCFDTWSGNILNSSGGNYAGYDTADTWNKQDYYDLYKWNTEDRPMDDYWSIVHPFFGAGATAGNSSRVFFQDFSFPRSGPSNTIDFSPKNAPWFFIVTYDIDSFGEAAWGIYNTGASGEYIRTFENITGNLCTGDAQLTRTKLYALKGEGFDNGGSTAVRSINSINAWFDNGSGYYTYMFMCSFGNWNPSAKPPSP